MKEKKKGQDNVVALGLYSKTTDSVDIIKKTNVSIISTVAAKESGEPTISADGVTVPQTSINNPDRPTQQDESERMEPVVSSFKAKATLIILLCVNLLNYMDRFTIAGVLIDIRKYYHDLGNSEAGIIQTAFICTYMICSPVFGYLGDRYSRKYIMSAGIFLWSGFTLCSSFVPADYFYMFVVLRALVGVGEASYSTIAPTIIADLFAKERRSKALMIFYFAIPVGSGLGYIVGSNVASLFHGWQYALRVTPLFGVICVILILMVCVDPPRGMSEGGTSHLTNTGVLVDIKALITNKSFVLSSLGFTCVAFVTGALAFLAPSFMMYATEMQGIDLTQSNIDLIFGGITVAAGFIGVAMGVEIARRYRKVNPRADALLCAFGLLTCVPFLFFSLVLSDISTVGTWVLIFIGETLLCLNWAVTADILLYVVIPTRRSLAESGQILASHALGDAISPAIIGKISDSLAAQHEDPERTAVQFMSIRNAFYLNTFVCVLGGAGYLMTALFIEKDRKRAEKLAKGLGDVADSDDDDDELLAPAADPSFVSDSFSPEPSTSDSASKEVVDPSAAPSQPLENGHNVVA